MIGGKTANKGGLTGVEYTETNGIGYYKMRATQGWPKQIVDKRKDLTIDINMKKIVLIIASVMISINAGIGAQKEASERGTGGDDQIKAINQAQAYEHFSRADLYEKAGNFEKAAEEYRLALIFDPESEVIKKSLIDIYFNSYRYEEALELLLQLRKTEVDDILNIANCYVILGNHKKAAEYFKIAADSVDLPEPSGILDRTYYPGNFQWGASPSVYYYPNQYLAGYYAEKKDYKKAEYYFRRSLGNDTTGIRWLYKAASFYRTSGQIKKARALYEQMAQNDSASNTGYLGLAAIKEMEKDIAGADSIYQIVADKNWNDAQLLAILSQALVRLGNLEEGVRLAYRVAELNPNDYFGARRLAIMLFSLGNYGACDSVLQELGKEVTDDPLLYYYRGRIAQIDSNYSQAEKYYTQTLALDDTLVEVWVSLAFTRLFLGDTLAAAATFDSAMTACPAETLRILFFTGLFYNQHGKYDEAIGYFDRVLQSDPRNTDALFNLGSACERRGRFEDAEKTFKRLLSIAPDSPQALNYLGYMWADKGINLDQARKMIARALEADPDNGAYLDSYAWVLYRKGKYKEALKYQEKAIQYSAEDPVLFEHMGDIKAALKDHKAAREYWRRALELDPSNERIGRKLSQ
jgi:tetratricopeptide (TPR) repeat protein